MKIYYLLFFLFLFLFSQLYANPFSSKYVAPIKKIKIQKKIIPKNIQPEETIKDIQPEETIKNIQPEETIITTNNLEESIIFNLTAIDYQGSAVADDIKIGLFFYKTQQYIIREGDTIGDIKILDIKKNYFLLKKNYRIHRINEK